MRNRLRTRFVATLNLATATMGDVAKGIGRGYRTVQAYVWAERRVTPDAARRLAAYLRERARAFNEAADELDSAAEREEGREENG